MRTIICCIFLFCSNIAKADLFGGDVAVLTQILVNAMKQLSQLEGMLRTQGDTLNLLKDVHRGIDDTINTFRTIDVSSSPKLYAEWKDLEQAFKELRAKYGDVPPSTSETEIQKDADQGVAEAIALNNSLHDYTRQIDKLGEEIKAAGRKSTPGGAQKLTAESMGIVVHILNSSLRTQASLLKLQAQVLALQNRRDKEVTKHSLASIGAIEKEFSKKSKFAIPRF